MKRIYFFILIFNVFIVHAQRVGVNTETSNTDVELKGTIRIDMLPTKGDKVMTNSKKQRETNKNKFIKYEPDYFLATDEEGNLMKIKKRPILDTDSKITETNRKVVYSFVTTPKGTWQQSSFRDNNNKPMTHCRIEIGNYIFSWHFSSFLPFGNYLQMSINPSKAKYIKGQNVIVSSHSEHRGGAKDVAYDPATTPTVFRPNIVLEKNGVSEVISENFAYGTASISLQRYKLYVMTSEKDIFYITAGLFHNNSGNLKNNLGYKADEFVFLSVSQIKEGDKN